MHGAAGLLLLRSDGRALLQLRARSQHAGTWGLPGGACHGGETAEQTALREAVEETGIDPAVVRVLDTFVDQHDSWVYTTMLATTGGPVSVSRASGETAEVKWVPVGEVAGDRLHKGLPDAWEHGGLRDRVEQLGEPEPSGDPGRQRVDPLTGWRTWYVTTNGALSTLSPYGRWPQVELDAECHDQMGPARFAPHVPHPEKPAPGEGCSCGIRIIEDLAWLLRGIRTARPRPPDGGVREHGDVAELTDLVDLSTWPQGMRLGAY